MYDTFRTSVVVADNGAFVSDLGFKDV